MTWFDQNKYKIFPDIKDWTDSQDKYRFEKNVNKLSYKQWFWFHPTAFSFISYGLLILPMIMFSVLTIYLFNVKLGGVAIIPILLVIALAFQLYKKIKTHVKDFTFYDLNMREYTTGGKKQ